MFKYQKPNNDTNTDPPEQNPAPRKRKSTAGDTAGEELKCTCFVYPNTGHHYFFFQFPDALIHEFKDGVQGKQALSYRHSEHPWEPIPSQASPGTPPRWLRIRYGNRGNVEDMCLGLWIAVETNLGTCTRGTIISDDPPEATVAQSEIPEEERNNPTPYRAASTADLANKDEQKDVFRIPLPVKQGRRELILEIVWQSPDATLDVDLIVDFGNTRTVVLALEDNQRETEETHSLSTICRCINTLPRCIDYPDAATARNTPGEPIVDSWFLLHEPQFSEWDCPPKNETDESRYEPVREYTLKTTPGQQHANEIESVFAAPIAWFERQLGKTPPEPLYTCQERMPQMFVEISPAMMGAEAWKAYSNIEPGLNICLSSPKRYLWDRELVTKKTGGLPWSINFNPWNKNAKMKNAGASHLLCGQICRYLHPDGRPWELETPPFANTDPELLHNSICYFPQDPEYPRCTAMVWTALAIIENAYRQITSHNWRKDHSQLARRLRSINLTFPSGWIAREKQYYKEAWQQAINIFTHAHMNNRDWLVKDLDRDILDGRPELCMELDEAVASQLPFVYSELNRLRDANLWIQLYGRRDNTACNNCEAWRVRVMTVDIGGGTCDSAIVEYRNGIDNAATDLHYKVLFRDCNTFAGDAVVKRIIEKVLLPSILDSKALPGDSTDAATVKNAFNRPFSSSEQREKWKRYTMLVLLPIVHQWFADMATYPSGIYKNKEGKSFRSLQDCGVDEKTMNDLNRDLRNQGLPCDLLSFQDMGNDKARLQYDPAKVNKIITSVLKNGIEPLGSFVAAYNVDLVTLSGKISEIPAVHELLCKHLPLRPERIIRMGNFHVGSWYPISCDGSGKIIDAKTVTAVGSALYVVSKNGLLGASWAVRPEKDVAAAPNNYWGLIREGGGVGFDNGPILTASMNDNRDHVFERHGRSFHGTEMKVDQFIGRQKYCSASSRPEQQYKLCWNGPKDKRPKDAMAVVIKRCRNKEGEDDICIDDIEFTNDDDAQNCDMENLELRLMTLPKDGFWMDSPRFDIDI